MEVRTTNTYPMTNPTPWPDVARSRTARRSPASHPEVWEEIDDIFWLVVQ